jgi:hypothetical protein
VTFDAVVPGPVQPALDHADCTTPGRVLAYEAFQVTSEREGSSGGIGGGGDDGDVRAGVVSPSARSLRRSWEDEARVEGAARIDVISSVRVDPSGERVLRVNSGGPGRPPTTQDVAESRLARVARRIVTFHTVPLHWSSSTVYGALLHGRSEDLCVITVAEDLMCLIGISPWDRCVCVCVCACVRACLRVCVCVCVCV